ERERDAAGRRAFGDGREDEAGIAETERLNRPGEREHQHIRRERGEGQRDERGDKRADDERLAPVTIREGAPERQEGQAREVREQGDGADRKGDSRELDAES